MKWQAYRTREATAQPLRPFDQQAAHDHIRRMQTELDQAGLWPEHLTAWLHENHPAALLAIRMAAKGVDIAFQSQDITGLFRVLAEYKAVWLEGLDLWREHRGDLQIIASNSIFEQNS